VIVGAGHKEGLIADTEVADLCREAVEQLDLDGKRVLALIPDLTRTAPVGLMFRTLVDLLRDRVDRIDFLVALGTHMALSEERILELLDMSREARLERYAGIDVFNHAWDDPGALTVVGTLSACEMETLSEGRYARDVPIEINRLVFDYDHVFIIGPTFPHEVVGFSGGWKYFFPGIAGPEIINFFHWLGALVTNWKINGVKDTVVRRVIDRAADFIEMPVTNFDLVVTSEGLKGLYIGEPKEAWSAAADLSAQIHVAYLDRTYETVLGVAPEMYDDIWTAGKVMYKLEPIVAEGGELIIYAPHITEVSYTHGHILDKIGYHCLDYFREQMDKFSDIPGGVMAHSTHVKGLGTYCEGAETPRVNVTLATGIPEERCRRVNLGYRDPASIRVEKWEGREAEGILVVHHAGEVLHRLAHDR
jgi:nickel-dependent lactate racemase